MTENIVDIIENNRRKFDSMCCFIESLKSNDFDRVANLCSLAAIYASSNICGKFNSKILEEKLVAISNCISVDLDAEYEKGSVLHVLSKAYNSGGHTRVCERWIDASDDEQKHSVLITSQGSREVSQILIDNIKNKQGELILLTGDSPVEKAQKLRAIASKYEKVILHVHMYDVLPILAFANGDFNRPVMFYNHADHLFWLGASISDLVVNFRSSSVAFNEEFRHIKNNAILPLPIEEIDLTEISNEQIAETKASLGIKSGDKVIITVGSEYKFKKAYGLDFIYCVDKIMSRTKDVVFLAVGPSKKNKDWLALSNKYCGRVILVGSIPYVLLKKYLQIASLAIDAFPLSSFVALLDLAKYNVPCVSLKTPLGTLDSFNEAGIMQDNVDSLIDAVINLVDNTPQNNKLYNIIMEKHTGAGFKEQVSRLESAMPASGATHIIEQDSRKEFEDIEIFLTEIARNQTCGIMNNIKKILSCLLFVGLKYFPLIKIRGKIYGLLSSYGVI